MPLAVVGSNVVVEVNGKKVRGRQYPWGVAEGKFTNGRPRLHFVSTFLVTDGEIMLHTLYLNLTQVSLAGFSPGESPLESEG